MKVSNNVYDLRLYDETLLTFTLEERVLEGLQAVVLQTRMEKQKLFPPDLELTSDGIVRWLVHRVIPRNRPFVHAILRPFGLSVNNTKGIIDVSLGLSLNDSFCLDYYRSLGADFYEQLCSMLVFDALIYNEDRHFGNFGLLRDSHTGEFIAPAPLFDNGMSLFNFAMPEDLKDLNAYAGRRSNLYGASYSEICKEVMGPVQKAQLQQMLDFKFTRHPSFNLPEERLTAIEKQLNARTEELLSIPIQRRKFVQ